MYLDFYGLKRRPFDVTPDPSFFYPSQKHSEALASLVYAVTEKRGFVVVTGEIGSGKTTVCRTLLQRLDPGARVALITNTTLTAKQLLEAICQQFGLATDRQNKVSLLDDLSRFLLERNEAGGTVVLIIDEAQNLTVRALEEMRLISNMETETQKLIQIMLLGQPELRDKLNRPDLEQLRQRISLRYHLKCLDREETRKYIEHRLGVAGNGGAVRFTKGALEGLYQFSKGTPRLINVICDQALLLGYLRETRKIDEAIIREIVAEFAVPGAEEDSRNDETRPREKRSLLRRLFRRKGDRGKPRREPVAESPALPRPGEVEEPSEADAEVASSHFHTRQDAASAVEMTLPANQEEILRKLGTLRLAGIWAENGHFLATIDGVQLKPGDRIFGMKVAHLTRDKVVFQCGETSYELAVENNGSAGSGAGLSPRDETDHGPDSHATSEAQHVNSGTRETVKE